MLPALVERFAPEQVVVSRKFTVFGLGESQIGLRLAGLTAGYPEVAVGFYPVFPCEQVVLSTAQPPTPRQPAALLESLVEEASHRLEGLVVAHGADTLADVVAQRMLAEGLTLALAESCTGGLIGHLVTGVAGSSGFFERGLVTYSNRAKMELLGVSPETLEAHGAVSAETAAEMAEGPAARRARGPGPGGHRHRRARRRHPGKAGGHGVLRPGRRGRGQDPAPPLHGQPGARSSSSAPTPPWTCCGAIWKTMRCFIALEMPPAVKEHAAGLIKELKSAGADVKWVAPENLHLTLQFLGEVEPERQPGLEAALARACAGRPVLELAVTGCGAFPGIKKPRVIWLGLAGMIEELAALAEAMQAANQPLGFEPEARAFKAHLTLGRLRERRGAARKRPRPWGRSAASWPAWPDTGAGVHGRPGRVDAKHPDQFRAHL